MAKPIRETSTRQRKQVFHRLQTLRPEVFDGTSQDPVAVELWLSSINEIFRHIECPKEQRLNCATFILCSNAKLWWQSASRAIVINENEITQTQFRGELLQKYFKLVVHEFLSIE